MIKKFLLLALIVAQLTTSCSNDETESAETTSENLSEQIANLVKQPYSKLTPAEQKIKLEAEANAMLLEMDKSKTSGAVEAIQNLGNLLDISSVDIFNGKNDNQIEDILNVSGVYGIYTWNSTKKIWIKTTSTTELKFVFPAKTTTTTNNATFSSKATSSDIKVKLEDTYGNWVYNPNTDEYTQTPSINDEFFLPTSVDANLTIDNAQAATFAIKAKYSNGKETPDDFSYKMILNDGYVYGISSKKGDVNSVESAFTYKEKNLVKFTVGSTAKIDALIDDNDALVSYRGKANGLVELMDNFVIVADIDIAGLGNDEATLEKAFPKPDRETKTYYTALNTYFLKTAEGDASNYNKNAKLILVSKKDGTKIADVIQRTAVGYSFYSSEYEKWVADASNTNYGGSWVFDYNNGTPTGTAVKIQQYDQVLYLKFNDNTEVEMSAYFSTGFDALETKFENFLKSFER